MITLLYAIGVDRGVNFLRQRSNAVASSQIHVPGPDAMVAAFFLVGAGGVPAESVMQRQWYVIDDSGVRIVDRSDESGEFWGRFDRGEEGGKPPEFNQLVVDAHIDRIVDGLWKTAPGLSVELVDVTDQPSKWSRALMVASTEELSVLGEPDVDLDDRVMARPWSEVLVEHLGCDGAFFGYDRAAETLHLVRFSQGAVDFAWCDSLMPGPSYAMVFDEQGRVTDRDPRRFALCRMGLSETSPFLDRFRFVRSQVERLGIDRVRPRLDDLPVSAAFDVRRIGDSAVASGN